MKKIKYSLLCTILALITFASAAQESKQALKDAERKAAEERERSFGGKKSQSTLERKKQPYDSQKQKHDGVKKQQAEAKEEGQVVSSNKDQDQSRETRGENTNPENSNSPAVIQAITSESGSPAMLSENNGEGRDGTNTRQRGTYKMAGAEIKSNLGLSKDDGTSKPAPKVLKKEEQPALVLDGNDPDDVDPKAVTETGKEGKIQAAPKEQKKQKSKSRKSKRQRDRDSG